MNTKFLIVALFCVALLGAGCYSEVNPSDYSTNEVTHAPLMAEPADHQQVVPKPQVKPKNIPVVVNPPKINDSDCDSNYSGCVPVARDVDCAGGSGNGPAYVRGPVRVTGYDKYDLDRDGDGIACE